MTPLGVFHLSAATLALVAGALVAWVPKGTPTHAKLGWVYVGAMVGVNASALAIYRAFGTFGPFHIAAIASVVTLVAGTGPLFGRRVPGWVRPHARWMSGSYVGLLAAAASEAFVRLPATPFWGAVVAGSTLVSAVGVYVIRTRVAVAAERFAPRGR
ncbi:MAG: DUF2306 domain-containing protein [Vicinamibacterales bacterium]